MKPGAALSLQSHNHRSEHWVVVEGMALVTVDDKIEMISEGQSIYVPLGAKHRMENPGKIPMILIEVQTGTYLRMISCVTKIFISAIKLESKGL